MAQFTFKVEILTHFSYTLDKLQKVYPSCEIVNQLMSLFEVLRFHEQVFDKETQESIADSALDILKNLANICKSIERSLETNAEDFSEEDREKIKEVLNFDSEYLLKLLANQDI